MTTTADAPEPLITQSVSDALVIATQGGVAAGNIAHSSFFLGGKPSHDDFLRRWDARSPEERYRLFWDPDNAEFRRILLAGDSEQETAIHFVQRRMSEGEGTHVSECAALIWSIPSERAGNVLDSLDDKSRATALRSIAADLLAGEAHDDLNQEHLAQLPPPHLAYILHAAERNGHGLPGFLDRIPSDKAAQVIVSEYGTGSWLRGMDHERSTAVLSAAAQASASVLAKRLTELHIDRATELFSQLSSSPHDFQQVTEHLARLSEWHLVLFAARSHFPPPQMEIVRPFLLKSVQVWPWWAATQAVLAISPVTHDAEAWNWLTRLLIWWQVWNAAAGWTRHLRGQRKRELKIFIAGAAAMLMLVIFYGALAS